jgi:hypothetical protein
MVGLVEHPFGVAVRPQYKVEQVLLVLTVLVAAEMVTPLVPEVRVLVASSLS